MRLESGHDVRVKQEAVEDADTRCAVHARPCMDERVQGGDLGGRNRAGPDFVLIFFGVEEGLGGK